MLCDLSIYLNLENIWFDIIKNISVCLRSVYDDSWSLLLSLTAVSLSLNSKADDLIIVSGLQYIVRPGSVQLSYNYTSVRKTVSSDFKSLILFLVWIWVSQPGVPCGWYPRIWLTCSGLRQPVTETHFISVSLPGALLSTVSALVSVTLFQSRDGVCSISSELSWWQKINNSHLPVPD